MDEDTGEITRSYVPERIHFKDEQRRLRAVAPFLEVFARTDDKQPIVTMLTAHRAPIATDE